MSLNSILAWRIISALSGYLIFTLPETVEDFDCLDEAAIHIGNSKENFDFELTRVFVRPRLPCDIPPERIATCEEKLVKVILLLESLVNLSHNQKFTGQEPDNKFGHLFSHDTKYKRLWALLELLETSRVPFNLINGPLGPAFNMPPDDSVAANLETVLDLNHFLDSVPLPQQTRSIPAALESSDSVEIQDSSIRDYATSAFGAIFSHLQHCQTEHKLMLYLPKQHDSSDCAPKILLDMFISVCPDHCDWQETQCGKRENLDVGPRTVRNMDLCSKIKDSQSDREGLHLHVTGDQIQNLSQATQTTLHSNKFPRKSLHTLLESGAFKGFDLDSMTSNRFSRGQKRTLATSIASSLCRLLGSEWVGKGWCAKDMLFLADEDGQSESDIPVGPFISCSPAGPYLADFVKWESKLANTKPPVFLFLGKLLLELDLGGSLDSHIEEELKKDTKETVWLLLSGIYENSKGHLEYGDAIDACLRFHKVRKIKFEAEELTGDPGEWCEWDRRYIKDVVEKLVVPSTSIPTAAKTTTSKVDHHGCQKTIQDTSKHSYLFSIRPRNSPRTSNSQRSGSRDNTSSASAVFSVPPQSSSSSSSSVSEVHHYQNSAPSKISKSQQYMSGDNQGDNSLDMTKATPNYHMSRWFAGLDSPNDPVHLNSQEPWQFFEIENTELEGENKRLAKWANDYWELIREFNKTHLPKLRRQIIASKSKEEPEKIRKIKIALIDTGVDLSDPLILPEHVNGRIKGQSWVGSNPNDFSDSCGHGTHLVRLLLQVNKTADIMVAKVSEDKEFKEGDSLKIAQAIRWAVKEDADIISLSLGFKRDIPVIDAELEDAINPEEGSENTRPRVVFAAASNWGYNFKLAFPACKYGVFCVYSVDGFGFDGKFAPKYSTHNEADPDKLPPFATLGVAIESEWKGEKVWLTGTSYAAPIAAAIAGNIIEFARRNLNLDDYKWRHISSFKGMRGVLHLMCMKGDSEDFTYLAPWHLALNGYNTKKEICDAIKRRIGYA